MTEGIRVERDGARPDPALRPAAEEERHHRRDVRRLRRGAGGGEPRRGDRRLRLPRLAGRLHRRQRHRRFHPHGLRGPRPRRVDPALPARRRDLRPAAPRRRRRAGGRRRHDAAPALRLRARDARARSCARPSSRSASCRRPRRACSRRASWGTRAPSSSSSWAAISTRRRRRAAGLVNAHRRPEELWSRRSSPSRASSPPSRARRCSPRAGSLKGDPAEILARIETEAELFAERLASPRGAGGLRAHSWGKRRP